MGWVEDALSQRSVMDPDQRSPIQEWLRGLAHSGLSTGAGLADMASMAIPGRPIGASLLAERLDRFMGDPNAPGAPAAYSGGGLLGDVAQMVTPLSGLLGGASKARVGIPNQIGAVGGGISDAERARRIAQQGYEAGWWRGGRSIADGPYYTPDRTAAEAFATRHGPGADVREYALRSTNPFRFSDEFDQQQLQKLADVLLKDYGNKMAAKELPSMASDFRSGKMPGPALYQVLDVQTGGNAQDALRRAGFDMIDAGQERVMLNMGGVRDANRAQFDPRKIGVRDPLAGILGLGTYGLLRGENDGSVR